MALGNLEVVRSGLGFLEAPRWHKGKLWFVDFSSRLVQSMGDDGTLHRHAYVAGQPSGIGFKPDGSVLVVSTHERHLLEFAEGRPLQRVADVGRTYQANLNDMVVDQMGRAYISPYNADQPERPPPDYRPSTPLIMVDIDGTVKVAADDLAMPNGSVISADGSTLIVAESLGARLTAFDVGVGGSLLNRRTFAEVPGRIPDGITLDAEGAMWIGCPMSEEFVRVKEGGQVCDVIRTPGRWAVACVLGGSDGRTLYCLTAKTTYADHLEGRAVGAIEKVTVAVPADGF